MSTHSPYNDKELFARIADGDEAAFKILYDNYLPLLVPFLKKLTGADTSTDEILQETFIRLWIGRDRLPVVEYPRAWIFEVASHAAYTWLKNKIRYQQALGSITNTSQEALQPVQEYLHVSEARRLINQAVDLMPAQRRKIYRMSREEGMTIPAIAENLRLSPSTVKNTLVTALAFIREHLQKAGYHLPVFLFLLMK